MNGERSLLTQESVKHKEPFLPKGFTYVTGTRNTGFVIADKFGNEFVWIPVDALEPNGTLDGISYNSQFGLRNWYNYDFSEHGWHEVVPEAVVSSIKEWGGFFFARNTASLENGEVVFKKGNLPLIELSFNEAVEYEKSFKTSEEEVEHCMMYGSAYDSLYQWIIQSGAKKRSEVLEDSTYLGNYVNNDRFYRGEDISKLLPTGSNEDWKILNIYDLAGNVMELSQERYGDNERVIRGGHYRIVGRDYPIADRYFREPVSRKVNIASFRSMLYHK